MTKVRVERKEIEEIVAKHFNIDSSNVSLEHKINAFASDDIYVSLDYDFKR